MYLIAAASQTDVASVRAEKSPLWRQIRRFNLPAQLAVVAAHHASRSAENPATMALVSLAPCHNGSPEVFRWLDDLQAVAQQGDARRLRLNPTITLHAVDNLALSAVAIALNNRRCSLGLGGTAGMAWEALDMALWRMRDGLDDEILLIAGDQDSGQTGAGALGVAMLLSARPAPFDDSGRTIQICAIERVDRDPTASAELTPHAAAGLDALVSALAASIETGASGPWRYHVPDAHGDGLDRVTVAVEVT